MAIRTKEDAARALAGAQGEKRFFCVDGYVVKDLDQLAECLDHMTDDAYNYHVSSAKNDFHNWVSDVIADDKLARDLMKVASRAEAAETVRERVVWLKEKATK